MESLIVNRYRLAQLLGQGSMGKVYRAEDTRLGKTVAIKLPRQAPLSPASCDRFATEAQIAACLSQQSLHIVEVTDYGCGPDQSPFYVMEYLQGQSLAEVIAWGPLQLPRFLHLMRQICLGLQAAHRGVRLLPQTETIPIIHRDLKPSNIWVCPDPTLGEVVKILDFGVAKVLNNPPLPSYGYMGTFAYSSPEQLEADGVDPQSDIYSLGVIMFEMLTGQLPLQAVQRGFEGWYRAHRETEPLALADYAIADLPPALAQLIQRCLAKEKGDRPRTIETLLSQIETLQTQYPQRTAPPSLETSSPCGGTSRDLAQPAPSATPWDEATTECINLAERGSASIPLL